MGMGLHVVAVRGATASAPVPDTFFPPKILAVDFVGFDTNGRTDAIRVEVERPGNWGAEPRRGSRTITVAIFPNGFPNPDLGPRSVQGRGGVTEWSVGDEDNPYQNIARGTRFYVTAFATNRAGDNSPIARTPWMVVP